MKLGRHAVLVILAVVVVSCGALARGPAPTPTRVPISRADFAQFVDHNLSERIVARYGPPSSTQASGTTGREYWYYHGLTYDPLTQKVDGTIQLVFEPYGNPSGGRLGEIDVNFGP